MGGHQVIKPTKYHTVDDIPDHIIPRYSKRDPDNMIYRTRRWVNFKKRQILYQQQDGIPVYLRNPKIKMLYYATCASVFGLFFCNIYKLNYHLNKKN